MRIFIVLSMAYSIVLASQARAELFGLFKSNAAELSESVCYFKVVSTADRMLNSQEIEALRSQDINIVSKDLSKPARPFGAAGDITSPEYTYFVQYVSVGEGVSPQDVSKSAAAKDFERDIKASFQKLVYVEDVTFSGCKSTPLQK